MPVKRRHSKRRTDPFANIETWRSVLECGYDFFDDLAELGIRDPATVWPPDARAEAAETFLTAATAAWGRHGAIIMETWKPNSVRQLPWAHEQFGAPPCR